jgi:hypothetical protein
VAADAAVAVADDAVLAAAGVEAEQADTAEEEGGTLLAEEYFA